MITDPAMSAVVANLALGGALRVAVAERKIEVVSGGMAGIREAEEGNVLD